MYSELKVPEPDPTRASQNTGDSIDPSDVLCEEEKNDIQEQPNKTHEQSYW